MARQFVQFLEAALIEQQIDPLASRQLAFPVLLLVAFRSSALFRASVALLLCSKALSAMRGRDFATPDDVRDIARPVLRHRISLRAEAELDGATADAVITDILGAVEVPR